jgi:hypothetical protein
MGGFLTILSKKNKVVRANSLFVQSGLAKDIYVLSVAPGSEPDAVNRLKCESG